MTNSDLSLSRQRLSVLALFFLKGMLFANWFSRIPDIKSNLDINEATLGLVLSGLSAGIIIMITFTGRLMERFGDVKVTRIGAGFMCALLPVFPLMPTPAVLWIALFLFGCGSALMEVSINAQAVEVERRFQRPIINSFHAAFSVGGFAGATIGAQWVAYEMSSFQQFIVTAALSFLLFVVVVRPLIPAVARVQEEKPERLFQLPPRQLWAFGIIVFCAVIGEGGMADWSAVYLRKIGAASGEVAAYGFAAFSLMMTIGRMLGDRLTARSSPATVVRWGGILGASGLLLAALIPEIPFIIAGFAAVGAGVSVIIPLAFSGAGRTPGISSSSAIAGVATIGYSAMFVGPLLIGGLAQLFSLRIALGMMALLLASLAYSAKAFQEVAQPVRVPVE